MQIAELYTIFQKHPSVETDTRKIKEGDLFFALKGENFNGNLFAPEALQKGAAYSIVDEYDGPPNNKIILVDDVLTTLQQLARHHRLQFNIPFVAVTGSNGKTTTKELLHVVLSTSYKTYTTQGNLNNHIGIPLTLLRVKNDAELVIVEMGANHQKEIASYCQYTLPTHGIITNCGKAHLEGFGGVEGVRKGKGELFDYLATVNGTVFVMWDYDYLREMSKKVPHVVRYGTSNEAEYCGIVVDASEMLKVAITKGAASLQTIHTYLVGDYNLPNVLAAVSVGRYFNVPEEQIKSAIENYHPSNSRSQLIQKDSNEIILDAYNANPTSMKLAIENFAKMNGQSKVLILGGMMELGADSIAEHTAIVELIGQYPWKAVALTGGDFKRIEHGYQFFENSTETANWFRQQNFQNSHILIKGSRSTQMEKVLE